MAANTSITIRRIDAGMREKLRLRAASHGRSMAEEAREILLAALATQSAGTPKPAPGKHLVDSIRRRFEAAGYLDLELPEREST